MLSDIKKPGDTIYVTERDEDENPVEVSGYMLLARVVARKGTAVIVTPFINDIEELDETLGMLVEETWEDQSVDLAVFPIEDCYDTREEAHEVVGDEDEGEEEEDEDE